MKPIISQLLVKRYFVTDLLIQANKSFDISAPMNLGFDALEIESNVDVPPKEEDDWEVTLKVFHQGSEKINSPYFFCIEVVGFFSVLESYPKENVEWLIRTNAPSVLYSTAREVLREAMATGPFKAVLLPAVSFYTEELKAMIHKSKDESQGKDLK